MFKEDLGFIIIGLIVGAGLYIMILGSGISNNVANKYKTQAIERGYALYCPTTGNFAWINECGDVK
jgi:hypothetical protein